MSAIAVLVLLGIGFFAYQYWKYHSSDHGAPYVAMEPEVVQRILRLAKLHEDDVLFDLGSGDGRIVITAALTFHCRAIGVEIDRFRYYYSLYQRFILRLGDKVSFFHKNLFDLDISSATVVIVYLTEQANEILEEKLITELKPGTLVISPSFPFTSWTPILVDEHPNLTTPWGPTYFYEIGRSNQVKSQ